MQIALPGNQIDQEIDCNIKQNRRNDGHKADITIWHANGFCEDKRARTHDWRHDLTAGRRAGLNRTRFLCGITSLLHHRDGQRTSRHNIGNRTAGDRTHCSTGDDGHLCRATAAASCDGNADVHKILVGAHALEECAKCEESEKQCRSHTGQRTEHTLGCQIGLFYKFSKRDSFIAEHRRAVWA